MEPVRHPSTGWYWIAAGLALVGVLGAIALGAVGYVQLQDRLEALPRTDVPGTVTVDVDGPQGVTVFYEDPTQGGFVARAGDANTLRFSPVDLAVTGPDGATPRHDAVRRRPAPARRFAGRGGTGHLRRPVGGDLHDRRHR